MTSTTAHRLPPRDERDWVVSKELIDVSGISWRQLNYWCLTGLLTALPVAVANERWSDLPITPENPGTGYPRYFHESQVKRAAVIKGLLDAGFSLQFCRLIIDNFLATGRVTVGPFTLTEVAS